MEFVTDFLGNEIRVGDKVICAHSKHASLYIGEVVNLGKKGTTIDVKVLIAPFEGYWKEAINRIGNIIEKVQLTRTVEESHSYRTENNEWMRQTYETQYLYAIKYDGTLPEKVQYKLIKEEIR